MRYLVDQPFVEGKNYVEIAGLSTESKPSSGMITGSQYMEVDTTKVYFWDETNEQWHEAGASNA